MQQFALGKGCIHIGALTLSAFPFAADVTMPPSNVVVRAFADKAKGVLVETHRLNSGVWDSAQAERHQDDL